MRVCGASGVWELFIPDVHAGALYKFAVRNRANGELLIKADPYARQCELRPATASLVAAESNYAWQDQHWITARQSRHWLHAPMSIYEVHLGSWRRTDDGNFFNYRMLAEQLVQYVTRLGFTHIELLPITEHPFDGSWGYQTTGYYAPTSRFGTPDDFRYFVDYCHQHNIGVILDWAPAHFPKDPHSLIRFDGTALYEHEDPRRAEHPDWDTLIFNYQRNEVRNFLIGSALYWLDEFHLDGMRVDAVASMLYLDYSRADGDWAPNVHGGRENLEAITFLRELNTEAHAQYTGCVVIAEESTAWPMVSRPVESGGFGFSMKWNMGWMHDTLAYLQQDPVHRRHHHNKLTFGLLYAFTENFVLPLSHDEVVYGKAPLIYKMPGDDWQRFANLRLLLTYQYCNPGKKLLFMGGEFGQTSEWDHDGQLAWPLRRFPPHAGIERLVSDLNRLYRQESTLHRYDFSPDGFQWLHCDDAEQSVLVFLRRNKSNFVLIAFNFTPVPRHDFQIGVPIAGRYKEILNTDSTHYGGSDLGNGGLCETTASGGLGQPYSLSLTLPPLAGLLLKPVQVPYRIRTTATK